MCWLSANGNLASGGTDESACPPQTSAPPGEVAAYLQKTAGMSSYALFSKACGSMLSELEAFADIDGETMDALLESAKVLKGDPGNVAKRQITESLAGVFMTFLSADSPKIPSNVREVLRVVGSIGNVLEHFEVAGARADVSAFCEGMELVATALDADRTMRAYETDSIAIAAETSTDFQVEALRGLGRRRPLRPLPEDLLESVQDGVANDFGLGC